MENTKGQWRNWSALTGFTGIDPDRDVVFEVQMDHLGTPQEIEYHIGVVKSIINGKICIIGPLFHHEWAFIHRWVYLDELVPLRTKDEVCIAS